MIGIRVIASNLTLGIRYGLTKERFGLFEPAHLEHNPRVGIQVIVRDWSGQRSENLVGPTQRFFRVALPPHVSVEIPERIKAFSDRTVVLYKQAAANANATASAAQDTADQALRTAEEAKAQSEETNAKIDQMFKKSMYK